MSRPPFPLGEALPLRRDEVGAFRGMFLPCLFTFALAVGFCWACDEGPHGTVRPTSGELCCDAGGRCYVGAPPPGFQALECCDPDGNCRRFGDE